MVESRLGAFSADGLWTGRSVAELQLSRFVFEVRFADALPHYPHSSNNL